jgi:hypothetical protein
MLAKSKVVAVSAVLVALAIVSIADSSSQAFARGGHGGGGRRGRSHSVSRSRGGRSMRSSRGRSNRKAYAHNQQHNNKHNAKHHNKHHNRHHHRHHGRYGWGDGSDDGGDSDGDGGDSDGAGAPDAVNPVAVSPPITILNPAETGRPVNYTLGSAEYSIEPSHSLAHNDGTQVITFERGASFGQAAYTLQPGTYRFVMTNTGWDLRTSTDQLAANSTASPE